VSHCAEHVLSTPQLQGVHIHQNMFFSIRPNVQENPPLCTENVLIRMVAEELKKMANTKRQPVPVNQVDSDEEPLTTTTKAAEKPKRQRRQGPKPSANQTGNPPGGQKRNVEAAFQRRAKATTENSKRTAKPVTQPEIPQQHKSSQERIQKQMAQERVDNAVLVPVIGSNVAARLPSGAGVHYGIIREIKAGTKKSKTTFTVAFEDGEVKTGFYEGKFDAKGKPRKAMTLVPYDGILDPF
jgi:hypothetical protein